MSDKISSKDPEFKLGKELATDIPGLDSKELDEVIESEGIDDSRNFKFGYNSVDKKAENFSKLDNILNSTIGYM